MRLRVLALALLLGACAQQGMQSYVDKPLSEPVRELGAPHRAFDTASGGRAYVWRTEYAGFVYGLTNTNLYTKGATTADFTTVATVDDKSFDCEYWLYARPNVDNPVAPEHWTVEDLRTPKHYIYLCR